MAQFTLPHAVCVRHTSGEQVPAWEQIHALELVDLASGHAPLQKTEVRLAYTPSVWWVQFRVWDDSIRATLTERNAPLYTEEVVEIFIDPIGDGLAYFELEVNPLNAVLDLAVRRIRSGLRKDFSWECEGLHTSVAPMSGGWIAELQIPFASLFPDPVLPGARWRANFCRIDRPLAAPRELSAWSPTGGVTFHDAHRFGVVEFS